MLSISLADCSWLVVAAVVVLLIVRNRRKPPYPPGPRGLPLLGNIFDLPANGHWVKYAEWSRQFNSDVIHLNLAGTHLLVVNSTKAAFDLFEKRSAIYSDRPRLPMLVELAGWEWTFALFRYGSKWRSHRRLFYQHFNNNVVSNFEPQQTKAAHELLRRFADTPDEFMGHIRLMAASLILSVAYGMDIKTRDDPVVVQAERALATIAVAGNPGSFLVDTLPSLKYVPDWFPGAGFKRMAKRWRKFLAHTVEAPFQYAKDQIAKGVNSPSVVSLSYEQLGDKVDEETEDAIRGVSATIYGAGVDTTVSLLNSFILGTVLYPEVVQKAQEELDRVVGRDRLPQFTDGPSLPYITAIVMEVLRWHPVVPLGLPHRLMADDVYDGKFMPAGSIVMGNGWAMLHDEKVYPDPFKFNPDRFIKNGEIDPDVPFPVDAFGFGRRSCAGRYFAFPTLFINIACIMSTFNIRRAVDKDGNEIIPSANYDNGILCHPEPFKCSIKPRSSQALDRITEAYAVHHPEV